MVTVVTGVSGSGKSSLVEDILWKAAARALHRAQLTPGAHEAIEGLEHINKVISVDQTPLGSTPSSTPATYAGVFDLIRELFAKLPESKVRGYSARRFSFNQAGGRCEACEGAGQKRIEMHFLPDVWITCDACDGRAVHGGNTGRQVPWQNDRRRARHVGCRGARVVRQRAANPENPPNAVSTSAWDIFPLGQAAPTLSGGEAQRVKLAAELARPDTGKTLYILDEPTTGLHFDDVRKLLDVIHRLADLGNTVIVIEHNLEVIKTADWVIDLGPEAGMAGGDLVAPGHPRGDRQKQAQPDRQVSQAGARRRPAGRAAAIQPEERLRSRKSQRLIMARPNPSGRTCERQRSADQLAEAIEFGTWIFPEAKAPWEIDGRQWHTRDRIARNGRPARWDGRILERIVDQVEALGRSTPNDPTPIRLWLCAN